MLLGCSWPAHVPCLLESWVLACWMLDARYGALLQRYFPRACTLTADTSPLHVGAWLACRSAALQCGYVIQLFNNLHNKKRVQRKALGPAVMTGQSDPDVFHTTRKCPGHIMALCQRTHAGLKVMCGAPLYTSACILEPLLAIEKMLLLPLGAGEVSCALAGCRVAGDARRRAWRAER